MAPPEVVMSGVGMRRLSYLDPCDIDVTNWSTWVQTIVNVTVVTAAMLILDQVKTILQVCCRKGNLMFYFAHPDNLFNLATTIVQVCSSVKIEVPNAIGQISRRVSRSSKAFSAAQKAFTHHKEIDELGEFDHTAFEWFSDQLWEVLVVGVTV